MSKKTFLIFGAATVFGALLTVIGSLLISNATAPAGTAASVLAAPAAEASVLTTTSAPLSLTTLFSGLNLLLVLALVIFCATAWCIRFLQAEARLTEQHREYLLRK